MALKDRQKSILGAVVKEYVRTARPVASRELARDFDFGLSSATLRSELLKLGELGYVEQPHTSAGRVPTDRGYRFFVDYILEDGGLTSREQERISEAFNCDGEEAFVKELSRAVSQISGMFTAAGITDEGVFYETGFSEILDEPEFIDAARIRAFGRLADLLDEEIRGVLPSLAREEECGRIFIGRENPWVMARDYTMALSSWEHPRGFRGFIAMIGPKRTNYQKHKAILDAMSQSYE